MKLHSIHFGKTHLFRRLADVLAYSAKKNSPNTPLIIHEVMDAEDGITSMKRRGITGHDIVNALKTKYHNDIVQSAENGELLCLMDLDVAITGDLSSAEQEGFDLGVTVRNQKARINSGVIFVRVSDKTKDWYQRWYNTVGILLNNSKLCQKMKRTYSAINQSALGILMSESHDLVIKEFSGVIWNCTPIDYNRFNHETKVIHLLNNARVLGDTRNKRRGERVATTWLELEQKMQRENSELL